MTETPGAGTVIPSGNGQPGPTPDPAAGQPQPAGEWYGALNANPETVRFINDRHFTDLNAFAGAAIEADRLARSRNVFEKPDPEKIGEWKHWADLGWKPDPKDYVLKPPRVPEGFERDAKFETVLRDTLHANRVPLSAAQAVQDALMGYAVDWDKQVNAFAAQKREEGVAKLRGEWGQDYDRKEELAKRAFKHFGGTEAMLAELMAIGSPETMRVFASVGEAIGEDRIVADAGGGTLPASLDQLDAQIRAFRADPVKWGAVQNARDLQHKAFSAEYQALMQKKAEAELAQRKR